MIRSRPFLAVVDARVVLAVVGMCCPASGSNLYRLALLVVCSAIKIDAT